MNLVESKTIMENSKIPSLVVSLLLMPHLKVVFSKTALLTVSLSKIQSSKSISIAAVTTFSAGAICKMFNF
jgi:hypothetical protein